MGGAASGVTSLSTGRFIPLAVAPVGAGTWPARLDDSGWILGLAGGLWIATAPGALSAFASVPLRGSVSPHEGGSSVVGFRPWTLWPFCIGGVVEVARGAPRATAFLPDVWRHLRSRADDIVYDERTDAVLLRRRNRVTLGTRGSGPAVDLRPDIRCQPASLSSSGLALVCGAAGSTLIRVSDGTVAGRLDLIHASVSPDGSVVAGWQGGALSVTQIGSRSCTPVLHCEAVRGLHGPVWSRDGGRFATVVRLAGSPGYWVVVVDIASRCFVVLPSLGDPGIAL